jgi:exopolysaccharide production protein ExoF
MNPSTNKILSALLSFFLCVTGHVSAQTSAQSQYDVGVQDVLKIRVGSWNGTNNTYEEWTGLSGNYTVGTGGTISFPYVGTLAVSGITLDAIADQIAQSLKVKIGLLETPAVAIEIAQYNPIFVAGDVDRPGEYKFRIGTTVRQAIAMAGGISSGGASGLEIDQNVLRAYGQRRFLIMSQHRLMLRISRLEAEIADVDAFIPETDIQATLIDTGLLKLEQEIFDNNKGKIQQRILSIDELVALLKSVIAGLEGQLKLVRDEIALSDDDLQKKRVLLERGTIRAGDVTAATRTLSQQRIREIELTVQKLQAEQSLIQANQDKKDIRKENMATLLDQLDVSRTKLNEIELAIETQSDVYASTLEFAGNSARDSSDMPLLISVIGYGETSSGKRSDSEQTILKPGDTIVVRIPTATENIDPTR